MTPPYVFEADGLATIHHSPFDDDPEWSSLYREVSEWWLPGARQDTRWRMWLLTRFALRSEGLGGCFAEFGTYRGGCSFMILATTRSTPIYLFDTFAGIPEANLTAEERVQGFAGRLGDTSEVEVSARLARWKSRARFVVGDVFETLAETETGPLSFAHVDLNAARPTVLALEYALERLVPGGVVVLDDYGWPGYEEQRHALDTFLASRPEVLIALPTGQALVLPA